MLHLLLLLEFITLHYNNADVSIAFLNLQLRHCQSCLIQPNVHFKYIRSSLVDNRTRWKDHERSTSDVIGLVRNGATKKDTWRTFKTNPTASARILRPLPEHRNKKPPGRPLDNRSSFRDASPTRARAKIGVEVRRPHAISPKVIRSVDLFSHGFKRFHSAQCW